MDDVLFFCFLFGFSCFDYVELETYLLVWLNPNQSNRMSAVQWYFPLWSTLVISGTGNILAINPTWPLCKRPKQSFYSMSMLSFDCCACKKGTSQWLSKKTRISPVAASVPLIRDRMSPSRWSFRKTTTWSSWKALRCKRFAKIKGSNAQKMIMCFC